MKIRKLLIIISSIIILMILGATGKVSYDIGLKKATKKNISKIVTLTIMIKIFLIFIF